MSIPKNDNELSPSEYFNLVKNKKTTIDDEQLEAAYNNALILLQKYIMTDQQRAATKLVFLLDSITRERKIVKLGISTVVYKTDIEEYIDKVSNDVVKITELRNFEREVPNEIVEIVEKVKGLFDELYVVFTDYTGKIEKQIDKIRREKDPILFGAFLNLGASVVSERFYFLGDWVDEQCDLTLERIVNEMTARDKTIAFHIETPLDLESLKKQLNSYASVGYGITTDYIREFEFTTNTAENDMPRATKELPLFRQGKTKDSWLKRVRTFLTR